MAVDFRLDVNLFNIRRDHTTTKLCREQLCSCRQLCFHGTYSRGSPCFQFVLAVVVRAYNRMGLTVNTTKTEVVCQWSASVPSTLPLFTVGGEKPSVVPSFKYLGSILAEDSGIDNDIQSWIKQASSAFGRLRCRVFEKKNLHPSTKVVVYQAVCVTTLLYSYEALVTYSFHIKSLEHFSIRCL